MISLGILLTDENIMNIFLIFRLLSRLIGREKRENLILKKAQNLQVQKSISFKNRKE